MSEVLERTARPKLLCVEDEPHALESVQRLLGKDFNVLAARNAAEAIALLDENPDVAIVLSDYLLPDQTGLELLARAQTHAPDAVRAIISGHVDLGDLVEAINKSILHRLILKPWDNEYFRIQMLEALVNHSTLREKRKLEQLSVTDPVTSLKNHRYFQDRLRVEVDRSLRHQREVTLLMMDLDHFKRINDQYGHPIGDMILRASAQRMLDQVRLLDTVARYGGEEFAIIMPDTSFDDAMKVAERIRKSFERDDFLFPNVEPIRVTISIGIASCSQHAITAQDLLTKADAPLLQAKSQGRNQTVGAK